MKKWMTQENFLSAAVFFIALANFFLPMAINLNGMMLTCAAVFILLQVRNIATIKNFLSPYFLLIFLLFSLYGLSLLYSDNLAFAKDSFGRKALLILFPVAFFALHKITVAHFKLIVGLFTASNLLVLLILVSESAWRAWQLNDLGQLIHTNLGLLFNLQATYFALYLVVNIVLLVSMHQIGIVSNRRWLLVLLAVFTLGVLLTGARSMYVALVIFGLCYFINQARLSQKHARKYVLIGLAMFLLVGLVIFAMKPLRERITETLRTDMSLLKMERFEHDTPFNGITLRLLFWKFGVEILNEKNAFLIGVGIGDAQDLLEDKFYQYNVYTGNPDYGDTGYLHYNYHNQFVQLTMHIGLIGLFTLLAIFGLSMLKISENSSWLMAFIVIVYLILFISESALERQFGLAHIFFWLPLLARVNLKNPQ